MREKKRSCCRSIGRNLSVPKAAEAASSPRKAAVSMEAAQASDFKNVSFWQSVVSLSDFQKHAYDVHGEPVIVLLLLLEE